MSLGNVPLALGSCSASRGNTDGQSPRALAAFLPSGTDPMGVIDGVAVGDALDTEILLDAIFTSFAYDPAYLAAALS